MTEEKEVINLHINIKETHKKHLIEVLKFVAEQIERGETKGSLIYKDNKNLHHYGSYRFAVNKKA